MRPWVWVLIMGLSPLASAQTTGYTTDDTPEYGKGGYDDGLGRMSLGLDFGTLLSDDGDNNLMGGLTVGYRLLGFSAFELSLHQGLDPSVTIVQGGPKFCYNLRDFSLFTALKPVYYAGNDTDFFGVGLGGGVEYRARGGFGWHLTFMYDKIFDEMIDHQSKVFTGVAVYF